MSIDEATAAYLEKSHSARGGKHAGLASEAFKAGWDARKLSEFGHAYRPSPPLDMVLHCPRCGAQHIDAPEGDWTNPPHRSHLCAACKFIWRPADVCTNGVRQVQTRGSADMPVLPVVILLRSGQVRSELHPYVAHEGRIVSSVSSGERVGRERFAVYESPAGSGHLLLVSGYGEFNVVNGLWTLLRGPEGTASSAANPEQQAVLLGYVEDQMEYIGAFGGSDSEDTPHYAELLEKFQQERALWK